MVICTAWESWFGILSNVNEPWMQRLQMRSIPSCLYMMLACKVSPVVHNCISRSSEPR